MKEYKCEYYSVQAAENSCFFCQHCTDIFFDYTNGPYMFLCDEDADTRKGCDGQCKLFKEEIRKDKCQLKKTKEEYEEHKKPMP